jgi:hypothetical protein
MKVIDGDGVGLQVSVYKKLFSKYVVQVGKDTFALPDDIAKMKLLNKEESRSFVQMLGIIILGLTIIGLIIAIPWLAAHKNHGATLGIQTKSGKRFVFVADNAAWKILKQYVGIGTMQEW